MRAGVPATAGVAIARPSPTSDAMPRIAAKIALHVRRVTCPGLLNRRTWLVASVRAACMVSPALDQSTDSVDISTNSKCSLKLSAVEVKANSHY